MCFQTTAYITDRMLALLFYKGVCKSLIWKENFVGWRKIMKAVLIANLRYYGVNCSKEYLKWTSTQIKVLSDINRNLFSAVPLLKIYCHRMNEKSAICLCCLWYNIHCFSDDLECVSMKLCVDLNFVKVLWRSTFTEIFCSKLPMNE